jgi:hypothetical protein
MKPGTPCCCTRKKNYWSGSCGSKSAGLRSCLIFFKNILPEKQVYTWQQTWRNEAESLAELRELDVALMTCDRMRCEQDGAAGSLVTPVHLQQVFTQMREQAAARFFPDPQAE